MTESESVALPLGDAALTNNILPHLIILVKRNLLIFLTFFNIYFVPFNFPLYAVKCEKYDDTEKLFCCKKTLYML